MIEKKEKIPAFKNDDNYLLKVLIVDDDSLVRIALKTLVNWRVNGFYIAGEAGDGNQALELIRAVKPDIVLLDIKMPVLDGLKVLEILKNSPAAPIVIVLSGYDDFDTVRKAMRLGAFDYLLKLDMQPETLLPVLKEASREISHIKTCSHRKEFIAGNADKTFKQQVKSLTQSFYRALIFRDNSFYQKASDDKRHLITADANIACLYIKIKFAGREAEEKDLPVGALIHIIEEIAGKRFFCDSFPWQKESLLLFLSHVDPLDTFNEQDMEIFINRVEDMALSYLNLDIKIKFGINKISLEGIAAAYDKVMAETNEYLSYLPLSDELSGKKEGAESPKDFHIKTQNPRELTAVKKESLAIKKNILPVPLYKAIKYIDNNFKEEMSLQDVAEEVKLNPSYLSNLFKKELGQGYSDYLTDLRIEEAKKLLKGSNMKMYEISEHIGYQNIYYLSRIFKKKTGMTPGDYRLRNSELE